CCVVFFFQAEDGIRDSSVTGVQTCALPISSKVDVYLGETQIGINELGPKIKAMKEAGAGGGDNVVKIRGDRDACYSDMMKVLGLARDAGYRARDRKSTRLNSSHT